MERHCNLGSILNRFRIEIRLRCLRYGNSLARMNLDLPHDRNLLILVSTLPPFQKQPRSKASLTKRTHVVLLEDCVNMSKISVAGVRA